MENTQEIWKDVIGYEGYYQVSNLGNVKGLKREVPHSRKNVEYIKERLLSQCFRRYCFVVLSKESKRINKTVHRLVAIAFIPNFENKPQVNHINGIRNDNRVENLEWNTSFENMQHSVRIGLKVSKKGMGFHRAKLTDWQIILIRRYFRRFPKANQRRIGERMGICYQNINLIIHYKNWKHIKI